MVPLQNICRGNLLCMWGLDIYSVEVASLELCRRKRGISDRDFSNSPIWQVRWHHSALHPIVGEKETSMKLLTGHLELQTRSIMTVL